MNELVTVIMPAFNASLYIEKAISSVLCQTHNNLELIIVNDGSTDDTEEKIKYYTDHRIIYFKQNNLGVSSARNLALRNMNGDYFCFLDSDDIMPERSLEARLIKFRQDLSLNFCDGQVLVYDSNMEILNRTWTPTCEGYVFEKLIRLSDSCFFGPTWMVKRDLALKYSFEEDMTHCEDLFFYICLANRGKYGFTKEPILKYRLSPSSAMTNFKALGNGYRKLFRKIRKRYMADVTIYDKVFLWLKIRKIMFLSFLQKGQVKYAFNFLFKGR